MSLQNIYDDPHFFESYKSLRQNNRGFNTLLEQPTIHSLLPDLKDKSILDIGCGFGSFCRYAREKGAAPIVGIDLSKNMIQEAQYLTQDNNIQYLCSSIEMYEASLEQFDLIVSSLAFHYVQDFKGMVTKIRSWLKPQGQFIFSVEHPICTAQPDPTLREDEQGRFHPLYNYRDEGLFKQTWLVEGVEKYHRTISSYINPLLENNFCLTRLLEPMPTDEQINAHPQFAIHKIRPPLLVISAVTCQNKDEAHSNLR